MRAIAEVLPPTLFPSGLPPSLLDWTTWLKLALYEDAQKVAEQSAVSLAACESLNDHNSSVFMPASDTAWSFLLVLQTLLWI